MTQLKTIKLCLAAVALLSSAGLAAAQSAVGGLTKPTNRVGGAAVQANPVIVTPRGQTAIPVSTPAKPITPLVATKQPPKN